jgi:hypothetical protein
MEGGHGCLIGLQQVDKEKYAESHPRAHMITKIVHHGNNMQHFIIGRQFLVVLFIFLINICGRPIDGGTIFDSDGGFTDILLRNSLALMIITIIIGQLTSQVNAAVCMIDFINNYFMLFTTYLSLAVEFSGLLHSVYLVEKAFSLLSGKHAHPKQVSKHSLNMIRSCFSLIHSYSLLLASFVKARRYIFLGESDRLSFYILLCTCCYY